MSNTNSERANNQMPALPQQLREEEEVKHGTIWEMYQFLDRRYFLLLFVGVIAAVIAGLLTCCHHLVIREMLAEVTDNTDENSRVSLSQIAGK